MNYSEVKQLFELFDGYKRQVKRAIDSINEEYVTIDEMLNETYFQHGIYYYSCDDFVVTGDGCVFDREDTFYCEGNEEYYHNDDMVRVYEGRNEAWYSQSYVDNNHDLAYFDGEYYDDCARDRHDIVYVEDTDEWAYRDNVYYHEHEGYYSYPDDSEEYVRGYHNGSYRTLYFSNRPKYKIGFEIEKEDEDVRNSIDIDSFECETNGHWRKEKDGSLCDCSGYELISPTFEFNINKIFEHIESNDELVKHINARHTKSCGGHIHLSEDGLSGDQLFNKIKGYTPLFYALYYGRVDKNFCKGKKNDDLQNENEKYQAIKIHHDRVEFRIISAVPSVNTLKWRSKLLMMAIQNPTDDVIKAYYNVDTKFTKLLKQVYNDDKLQDLKHRFINYTQQFEGLDIK
jgi:hypothetical protein